MPETIEAIKEMWAGADSKQREDYLFRMLGILYDKISDHQKLVVDQFNEMKKTCECRQENCGKKFVSKRQAKIGGIFLLIFAIGLGIGAGYLTWTEFIRSALPHLIK